MRDTRYEAGSALILAVVLVSLLAVVGVMFAMVARIDKMSTSAIAENKTLNLAVDTVIAKISQELASDTPVLGEEYYDYPDVNNAWLANLEPYEQPPDSNNYYWRQISNITGSSVAFLDLPAAIIPDYQNPIDVNNHYPADADGDGVSDSMWIELDNITSSKGRPIYAAVRIIDNGAMLNVNTGYKFDPGSSDPNLIDGSSQMQINLAALSERGANGILAAAADKLQAWRCGTEPSDLAVYEWNVIWRYGEPNGAYIPFDISDELKLRNRYILNYNLMTSRIEELWERTYDNGLEVPRTNQSQLRNDPNYWFWKANNCSPDVNEYDYRHISTNYNMDRIINPVGGKMVNINNPADANANELYGALLSSIDPNINPDMYIDDANRIRIKGQFAQLAANVVDFIDDNNEVTVFKPDDLDIQPAYYGFDVQPFITEIGFIISDQPELGGNYYAVELYNPFDSNIPLADFELELRSVDSSAPSIPPILFGLGEVIAAGGCLVIVNVDDPPFDIDTTNVKVGPQLAFFGGWQPPPSIKPPTPPGGPPGITPPPQSTSGWKYNYILYLKRKVGGPTDPNIYVDRQWIDPDPADAGPGERRYFGRDVRDWRVIYQTPDFVGQYLIKDTVGTLGRANTIVSTGFPFSFFLPNRPQKFITVGDIPRILTIGHGIELNSTIGEQLTFAADEGEIRLDLQNPYSYYRNIFQYLTVFDPSNDNIDNDGDNGPDDNDRSEWKIPGRININTAPWYVIAQLPWMRPDIAQYVISYRDTTVVDGFKSIGDLMQVAEMSYYADDSGDLTGFPDLTADDDIIDDFEERDVIFSRISNLVTVRSDVFTAYILVRIGTDGPQKRAIAILDRSDVYPDGTGRVKVRALHPVPDPR